MLTFHCTHIHTQHHITQYLPTNHWRVAINFFDEACRLLLAATATRPLINAHAALPFLAFVVVAAIIVAAVVDKVSRYFLFRLLPLFLITD